MRVRVVIGTGLALVAGLVLVLLLLPGERRAGSNYVPEYGPVTELRGQDTHCETSQLIPADTAGLNLLVGTYGRPTPRIDVTVTAPGQGVVTRGVLPAGRREGRVVVPVRRVEQAVNGAAATVLLTYFGRRQTFTLTTKDQPDRTYTSITRARSDGNNARVWGGMHFPSTVEISDRLGETIAKYVNENSMTRLRR